MMNRRQFVYATAAGVVTFARGSEPLAADSKQLAADYDLIVKGGRVIDPSLRLDAIRDVAITGGRIAAIEADIAADAAEVIDATGKVVLPGLIDLHTHYARNEEGALVGLAGGVTGWVDAGSAGADQIDDMVDFARSAPQPARMLINIGRAGILPDGDTMDLRLADVGAAQEAIARNRDVVVGVKARLTRGVAADDVEVLRRAQEVASSFDLPVMIHMGQTASPLATLLSQLKRGDIVTHMFAPPRRVVRRRQRVKARLTRGVAADDVEVLRRAQEVASSFDLPVMIHMGQTASPLATLLSQLKRGDIVTHMFAPPRRVVRRRQRTDGSSAVGHLRWDHSGGFLARYDLHRREHDEHHRGKCHRFPQRSVQVPELRDDVGSGRRPRDRQCFAHLPAVP